MDIKKTITSIFIVPTLSIGRERLADNEFINGYLTDSRREIQYDKSIYLLFKPKNLDKFRMFLDKEYERTKSIVDDYDYEDGYVVVVYKLNEKLDAEIQLIKEGKYSKTSSKFQDIFPKTIKVIKGGMTSEQVSTQYKVFNKTDDLRKYWEDKLGVDFNEDIELWSVMNEEEEILNLDKIKQHV